MLKNNTEKSSLPLTNSALKSQHARAVEIADALPMRLYALDLARHAVTAPNGSRYVVATFDDTRIGRGYVTGVYPQQNGYLTLVRLPAAELSSDTPDEAYKRHVSVVQAIQQGRLNDVKKTA